MIVPTTDRSEAGPDPGRQTDLGSAAGSERHTEAGCAKLPSFYSNCQMKCFYFVFIGILHPAWGVNTFFPVPLLTSQVSCVATSIDRVV